MDDNQTPNQSSLRDDIDARLPAAAFLRYESRADGWSAGRQAAFLSHLADRGVVEDAARCVGKHISGGYALRREARGYAFNLGWEAALIIARRIVADNLMAAAIRGEQSRWVREDGVTTYTRQNTKLSLTLLDRVNPATTLPEVMAVAARFDWFVQLIGDGVGAQELWDYFFDDALPHSEMEARERVRASLLLTEESADFERASDDAGEDAAGPIEYKSVDGPPQQPAVGQMRYRKRDALVAGLKKEPPEFPPAVQFKRTSHPLESGQTRNERPRRRLPDGGRNRCRDQNHRGQCRCSNSSNSDIQP